MALLVLALGALAVPAAAQSLAGKARESGCVDSPRVVEGSTYRCSTASGAAAYFNVPGGASAASSSPRAVPTNGASAPVQSAPAGFPRVDADTQKGRDEMRRKVLGDEIAAEEKLLAESRAAYNNGAPVASPEERANPQRYAERIGRLRDAVRLHERNIELLRKELSGVR